MFIIDKPYVSDLLKNTINRNEYKVLKNDCSLKSGDYDILFDDNQMIEAYKANKLLYLNSENSIDWIINKLPFSDLPEYISVFKNKYLFRELIGNIYPDFYFREVNLEDLKSIDIETIKKPFVIKPTVGFLSMGVYTIRKNEDWEKTIEEIMDDVIKFKDVFPKEVIDTNKFIIEEYIDGTEYAFDAYYNNEGKPVIINILKHVFASSEDVSDRLYITSKEIIEEYQKRFQSFLEQIGEIINMKNFPLHVEVRVKDDTIIPIEINPVRFAGWCTTDIAYYAYGINPYEYLMEAKEPDWKNILTNKEGKIYSLVIMDKPKSIEAKNIKGFDYDKLASKFEKILEMRKTDINKYPIFGYLFAETRKENYSELENILKNDLTGFIIK